MAKNFFIYIPIRDDWGVINQHQVGSYIALKRAIQALNKFDSGHITDRNNRFVVIKNNGQLLYQKGF